MQIKSTKFLRTFVVAVPDFETRIDGDGVERPWLTAEVEAEYHSCAIHEAFTEWAELWPSLVWPRKVGVHVLKTHYPDGSATGHTRPDRMEVKIK